MSDDMVFAQDPEGLVQRYLANPRPDLKDLILVRFAPTVERIARKFAGIEPVEDLVQVGFIGLLNALNKFDPQAGVRFNTYSSYLIAGEIKHYLRDKSQTIRHPAWLQELRHKVVKAQNLLRQEIGREPTAREIADAVGISEQSVDDVFSTAEMLRLASLDAPLPGESDSDSEVERLDASDFCPEQLTVEDRLVLEQAMGQLRDLERDVLVLFHFEALNQTEIAAKLGISCNYVSHILRQSLAKLRKIMETDEAQDRMLKRQISSVDYEVMDTEVGAYTEAFFKTRLQEEIHRASAEGAGVAIILVRFSGLESMRSFYGPQSVVDFLTDAAEFIRDNLRRLDTVARYGVDGFGIILPMTGPNVAVVRQRLLNRALEWTQSRVGATSGVRFELGESSAPRDGRTVKELIRAAKPQESWATIAA